MIRRFTVVPKVFKVFIPQCLLVNDIQTIAKGSLNTANFNHVDNRSGHKVVRNSVLKVGI